MAFRSGDRLGALELVASVGAGGMGEVYRARDTRLGRDVAVKVLPEGFGDDVERRARLEQEARSLASLNHPNVAVVYGLEEHHGRPCLVMEFVPGATLAEKLASGPLPLREALEVCRQLAEGLGAAHAAGLIHRDLKPSNVKVTPEGRVKLLDFGLAKTPHGHGTDSLQPTSAPLTRVGEVLGTLAYMSPEQARGQPLDSRTDVWSFGCVLFEALAGCHAFQADTPTDTLVALIEREPDWTALPATTPPVVRSLIQKCLQKDRSQRLHDIADARIELEDALATMPMGAVIAPKHAYSGRRWRPWLVQITVGVVVLAALGIGLAWRLRAPVASKIATAGVPVRSPSCLSMW